jgi:hypothetical protein
MTHFNDGILQIETSLFIAIIYGIISNYFSITQVLSLFQYFEYL